MRFACIPLCAFMLMACQPTPAAAPTVGILLAATPVPVVTSMPTPSLAPTVETLPAATSMPTAQPLAITVDGMIANGEWDNAQVISVPDGVIGSVRYGLGSGMLFVRLDARTSWDDLGAGTVGVYIGTPRAAATTPTTQAGSALGFSAGFVGELFFDSSGVSGAELKDVSGETWSNEGTSFDVAQQGSAIELAIPLQLIRQPKRGDMLQLRVVANDGERDVQFVPSGEVATPLSHKAGAERLPQSVQILL